jgi:hypothetical protein
MQIAQGVVEVGCGPESTYFITAAGELWGTGDNCNRKNI